MKNDGSHEEDDPISLVDGIEDGGINERVGRYVVEVTGTMWFAYVLTLFIFAWMLLEIVHESATHGAYDYEFPLLMTLMTVVQVLLPTFILVGQVQQSRRERQREEREMSWMMARDEEAIEMQRHILELTEIHQGILRSVQRQQEAIVKIQDDRLEFYDSVSSGLLDAIAQMSKDIQQRPCMLEEIRPGVIAQVLRDHRGM